MDGRWNKDNVTKWNVPNIMTETDPYIRPRIINLLDVLILNALKKYTNR